MATRRRRTVGVLAADPNAVRNATREETLPVGLAAVVAGSVALAVSATHGTMLLYGDAVAHLGIARGIVDTRNPGLGTLGGVWLPLPHLLMLPFIGNMEWWQNGMAGAWPSLICYVLAVMGMYRLARKLIAPRWALVATAFFGLNANLLYLATTPLTEPLFLALLLWIVVTLFEFRTAVGAGFAGVATKRMVLLGMLVLGATLTRYDGWVLGAAAWACVAWTLWKAPQMRTRVMPGFITLTLLAAAGPVSWLWYNHVFGHDWLDFMRGPYSAKEIDRKTSPPGAHKYWGWHNPAWSLMLYARTAQVDAAWWESGWLVAGAALWGTCKAWFAGMDRSAFLLWLPLPFYVYSISYGSVPIFIPQLYPHSFYNSRYGMEMLPVLAVFGAYGLAVGTAQFRNGRELVARLVAPLAGLLIVVNLVLMLHATPLVLKEAQVNSRGRLALEEPLVQQMRGFGRGAVIVLDGMDHVGALQKAGIPLRQVVTSADYYGWQQAMSAPAEAGNYVVAVAGGALDGAVKAHPEGLTELSIVCASTQPCVRIYESAKYVQK